MDLRRRLNRVGALGICLALTASCSEAPTSPDVMSELPGEIGERTFSWTSAAPMVECLAPTNNHTVVREGPLTAVKVSWSTNVAVELRAGIYKLAWYDNGVPVGEQHGVQPVVAQLAYGEHLVTLALLDAEGRELSTATSRCSLRIRVTQPCTTNADCADEYDCNVNECTDDGTGTKTCSFSAVNDLSCCQQRFECSFGQQCDVLSNQCVDCMEDRHCDDGNKCTVDSCLEGRCSSERQDPTCCDCSAGAKAAVQCDDGLACTVDGCNCAQARCVNQARPEGATKCCETGDHKACDDGDVCNVDLCINNVCRYTPRADAEADPSCKPTASDDSTVSKGEIPYGQSGASVSFYATSTPGTGVVTDLGNGLYSQTVLGTGNPNQPTQTWATSAIGAGGAPKVWNSKSGDPAQIKAIVANAVVHSGDPLVNIFVQASDENGRPVSAGTAVVVAIADLELEGQCSTDSSGQCLASIALPEKAFAKSKKYGVSVTANKAQVAKTISTQKALKPAALKSGSLGLDLLDLPSWTASNQYKATLVANTGDLHVSAYDVEILFDPSAVSIVAVDSASTEMASPVWNALPNGQLRINSVVGDAKSKGVTGTRIPVATITFKVHDVTGKTDALSSASVVSLVTSTNQTIMSDGPLPIAGTRTVIPRQPVGAFATPLVYQALTDKAQNVRVTLASVYSDGKIERSSYDRAVSSQDGGLVQIDTEINGLRASTAVQVAVLKSAKINLTRDTLTAISDWPKQLQTANVTVVGNWAIAGNVVAQTDITDQVTIETDAALTYSGSDRVLSASKAGQFTVKAISADGTVIAKKSITVDPSTAVAIKTLNVVAPCEVRTVSVEDTESPITSAVHTVSVASRLTSHAQRCKVSTLAVFDDGSTMMLPSGSPVTLKSSSSDLVSVDKNGLLRAHDDGNVVLAAALSVKGNSIAAGEVTVASRLPKAVGLRILNEKKQIALSSSDGSATVKGLPTSVKLEVAVDYADGSEQRISGEAAVKFSMTPGASAVRCDASGVCKSAGQGKSGKSTVTVRTPAYPHLSRNVEIEVVSATQLTATTYETYSPQLPRQVEKALSRIEGTSQWQSAVVETIMEFSDGSTVELSDASVSVLSAGTDTVSQGVARLSEGQITAIKPGKVDLVFEAAGLQARIDGFVVGSDSIDVEELTVSAPATISGIKGQKSHTLAISAKFSDGTHRRLAGDRAVVGLLNVESTVPDAASVNESGVVVVNANRSTLFKAGLNPTNDTGNKLNNPGEIAVDCNLVPAVGDFDIGDTSGLALKDRQIGDIFTLAGRVNTGDEALGAFDVELHYDPEVLEVVGVQRGSDTKSSLLSANSDSEPGKIFINAALDPTSSAVSGAGVEIFQVKFKALKGGDGISSIGGVIRNVTAADGEKSIGADTPRDIVAGKGELDPNCADEPIFGDANDNCTFGAEDPLFVQRWLAGQVDATDKQKEKTDAFPDGQITVADALYLSQVLAKLSHFIIPKVSEHEENGLAYVDIHVIDRDQKTVTGAVDVRLEAKAEALHSSLKLDNEDGVGLDPTTKIGKTKKVIVDGINKYRGGVFDLDIPNDQSTNTVGVVIILAALKADGTPLKTVGFLGSKEIKGSNFTPIKNIKFPLSGNKGCNTDSDCDKNHFCDNTKGPGAGDPLTYICKPKTDNGTQCPKMNACKSGHCQNTFCCDKGDCCDVVASCPAGYTQGSSCNDAASCQGTRKLAQCISNQCTSLPINDDTGCTEKTVASLCGCYESVTCNGQENQTAPTCQSGCKVDADCDSSCHCDGTCEEDQPNGSICDENTDCVSGYCSNGFCCDKGLCCNNNSHCSSLDKPASCTDETTCQGTYTVGQCSPISFQCEPQKVDDDSACDKTIKAQICSCSIDQYCSGGKVQTPPSCPLGGCKGEDNSLCKTVCHCDAGNCIENLPDGSSCDEASDCVSGYCNNGYCCTNDGTDPVCCGKADNCPVAQFSSTPICYAGSYQLTKGFSGEQGTNQWRYDRYNPITGYKALNWDGSKWVGPGGAQISKSTMLPSATDGVALGYIVRGGGELRIIGAISDADKSAGDGVKIQLRVNDAEVYNTNLTNGGAEVALNHVVDVSTGDIVRLVILPNGDNTADTTNIALTALLSTCQGQAGAPNCTASVCSKVIVEHDGGCGTSTIARTCAPYKSLVCDGTKDQQEPACAESCTKDSDAGAGAACVNANPLIDLGFDEGTGLESSDVSGNRFHADLVGGNPPKWAPGSLAWALSFTQSATVGTDLDEAVQIRGSNTLRLTKGLGVAALIRWGGSGSYGNQIIVGKGSDWGLGIRSGKLTFHIGGDTGNGSLWELLGNQSVALEKDQWQHVAGSFDGSVVRLYLNGNLIASAPYNKVIPYGASNSVYVGQLGQNKFLYKGLVDQAIVTDFALTSSQLQSMLKNVHIPPANNAGNLASKPPVTYLLFDEGSGTTAQNSGLGGFGGQLKGTAAWAAGKWGSGISLDGKEGSHLAVVGTGSVDLTKAFTIAGWAKPSAVSGIQWMASKYGTVEIGINKDVPFARVYDSDSNIVELKSKTPIIAGKFYHFALRFDGERVRLLLDGRSVASAPVASLAASTNLIVLGVQNTDEPATGVFKGVLDEWLVTNYAISTFELVQHIAGILPGSGNADDMFGVTPFSYLTFDIASNGGTRFANIVSVSDGGGNGGLGPDFKRGIGTSVGPAYPKLVQGRYGHGLSFSQAGTSSDARQEAVKIVLPTNIDFGAGFTITSWLKWGGSGDSPLQWIANKSSQFGVGIQDGKLFAVINSDPTIKEQALALGIPVPKDEWVHIGATWDTTRLDLYINGVLKGQVLYNGALISAGEPLYIGQDGGVTANVGQLLGTLDEFVLVDQGTLVSDMVKHLKGLIVPNYSKLAVHKRHNGLPCPTANGACLSDYCQNDFCCSGPGGDCCSHGGQCPGSYTVLPACQDASNCQGTRGDPVCPSFVCATSTLDDDSACTETTESKACGCYPSEFCAGDVTQTSPICPTSCGAETDCDSDCTCEDICVPKLPTGKFCDENEDCTSGFCVDSVCCDVACEGNCEACNVTGNVGQCTAVPKNTDPAEECSGTGLCGGTCDGAKGCQFPATTIDCGNCVRCDGLGFCKNFNKSGTDLDLDCSLCQVCDGSGNCKPASQGTDIKSECSESPTATCQKNGVCDGTGKCQLWVDGTVCKGQSCSNGFVHVPDQCDGDGQCVDQGTIDCLPYKCEGEGCATGCTDDDDCADIAYCVEGKCSGKKDPGEQCSINLECGSGFCSDGVCCTTSCTAVCRRCDQAGKKGTCTPIEVDTDPDSECTGTGVCGGVCDGSGGCKFPNTTVSCGLCDHCTGLGACGNKVKKGSDPDDQCGLCGVCDGSGVCESAVTGVDPKGECAQEPQSTCGQDGVCDGSGGCNLWVDGTECEAPKCQNGTGYTQRACNGFGTCKPAKKVLCAPYVCGVNACLSDCTVDEHCIEGYWCDGSQCAVKKGQGESCVGNNACKSGFCSDGVCCENACNAECRTCNAPGKAGKCTNFLDNTDPEDDCTLCQICDGAGGCRKVESGFDPLNECSQLASATCKNDGTCDGAGACRLWVKDTICVDQSCTSGIVQKADTCNGSGTCIDGGVQDCAPYKCSGTDCKTNCGVDSDCVSTHWCNKPLCQPKKDLGDACGGNNECKSEFCIDGVCCEDSCPSACSQCNLIGTKGSCAPHTADTDPEDGCGKYFCNGKGQCHKTCEHDGSCVRNGLIFNGSTSYVEVPHSDELNFGGNSWTVETWVKFSTLTDCQALVRKGVIDQDYSYWLHKSSKPNNNMHWSGADSGAFIISAKSGALKADQWHHIAGVFEQGKPSNDGYPPGEARLYVDGNLVKAHSQGDGKDKSNKQPLYIGADWDKACKFNGAMDAVRISKSARYNGSFTPPAELKSDGDTIALWTFNEGTGNKLNDSSGNAHHGQVTAGTWTQSTSCNPDADCKGSPGLNWCNGNQCEDTKNIGQPCSGNNQCKSGFCADGVCCNSGCSDECRACNLVGSIGTCNNVSAGTDPDEECAGTGKCGGTCDGGGACQFPKVTVGCGECRSCNGKGYCGFVQQGQDPNKQCSLCQVCDGNGKCINETYKSDVKNECTQSSKESCGLAGYCSGKGDCAYYETDVICVAESCSGAAHFFPDKCNGAGSCTDGGTEDCTPYICSGISCLTSCESHADCVTGYWCRGTQCVDKKLNGNSCSANVECKSGHCSNGFCCSGKTNCGSKKSCAQLGWGGTGGNPDVCAATSMIGCSGLVNYDEAVAYCENAGGRLCSFVELNGDEAKGTGCGYDSQRIWTSTSCGEGSVFTQAGASYEIGSKPKDCTAKSQKFYARCCADNCQPNDCCGQGSDCTGNKTCESLGWDPKATGGAIVCANSDLPCAGLKTHAEATALCDGMGARLCTIEELSANEAANTGCGYSGQRVWTSSDCSNDGVWTQAGAKANIPSVPKQCTPTKGEAYVTCCADKFPAEHARLALCQEPGNCIGDRIDAYCDANNQCKGVLKADNTACKNVTCVPGYCTGASGVLQHIEPKACNVGGDCAVGGSVNVCNDGNVCTDDNCGNPSKSAKNCTSLGWGGAGWADICGESDLPNCSGLKTYAEAQKICTDLGGRLCTFPELANGEVADTGCGYDAKRVWSSTQCTDGRVSTQAGSPDYVKDVPKDCTDISATAYVRCCADTVGSGGSGCQYPNNKYAESCYEGPNGTKNVGECKPGTKTCADGAFGKCADQILPVPELCNGKDDDCDGQKDEAGATGCKIFYKDVDDDGYGVTGDTKCLCVAADPYTATKGTDCDDKDGTVNPGATEACNGKDDDCDNIVDEEDATGCKIYYKDVDNDNYGLTNDKKCLCKAVDPYDATADKDCNDSVATTHPNAKELCNAVDDDCDNDDVANGGGIDEDYPLGKKCDSASDDDLCQEGKYICNAAQNGVTCINDGTLIVLSGERIDASVAVNEAGPKNDGALVGGIKLIDGKVGKAFDVSGGGYVRVPHDKNLTGDIDTTGVSYTYWAKANSTPGGYAAHHVLKSDSTTKSSIAIYHFGSTSGNIQDRVCPYFSVNGTWSSCCDWNKNKLVAADGWVHYGVTFSPDAKSGTTTVAHYINGTLSKQCKFGGNVDIATSPLKVGRGSGSEFPGAIDEFAMWSYGLDSTQVEDVFKNGVSDLVRNQEICDGKDNNCSNKKDDGFTDLTANCTEGVGQCSNTGSRICHSGGLKSVCSVTGKVPGTKCNDSVACTYTDVCSGGDDSKCGGTPYTCSGTCRSCDGNGTCIVNSGNCFISACDPAQPDCGNASTCYKGGVAKGSQGDAACQICSPSTSQKEWTSASTSTICRSAECTGTTQTVSGTSWDKNYSSVKPSNAAETPGGIIKCTGAGCGVIGSKGYIGYPVGVENGGTYTVNVKYADYLHNCKDKIRVKLAVCAGNNTGCKALGTYNGEGINDWNFAKASFKAPDGTVIIRVILDNDFCCGCTSTCDKACTPLASNMNLYVNDFTLNLEGATDAFVHHEADTCGSGVLAGKCIDKGISKCEDNNVCTDNNCGSAQGCVYDNNSYQESCYTGPANTVGIGTCTKGIKTCSGGSFGGCIGEVTPVVESCAVQGEDGLDNNCDGLVDNIIDFTTWYRDKDTDNHGNPAGPTKENCEQPKGYAELNDDCDDEDNKNYPTNTEICDDQDNNCDKNIDETSPTKGNACDGPDHDSCQEGFLVCKGDNTKAVHCGNTDGPTAVYDFDYGGPVELASKDPSSVAGLALWLKADAGLTTNGNKVSAWKDQSGKSLHLTSAGGVTVKSNALNGKPVIHCNGSGSSHLYRNSVSGSALFDPSAATVFVVQKQHGADARTTTLAWRNGNGDKRFLLHATWENSIAFQMGNPAKASVATAQPGAWDDQWHLVTARRNGSVAELRVDGSTIATGTMNDKADTGSSQKLTICNDPFGNTFTGDIAEIIIYRGALVDSERTAVESYLASKYGIATASLTIIDRAGPDGANDLVAKNGTQLTTGKVKTAASFDGTDDYVIGSKVNLLDVPEGTISVWVRPEWTGGDVRTVLASAGKSDGATTCTMRSRLWIEGKTPYFGVFDNGWKNAKGAAVKSNDWNHLLATWKAGDTVNLWVNGVKAGGAKLGNVGACGYVQLGAEIWSGKPKFVWKGLIDEVAFYKRVLTDDEAKSRFNNGVPELEKNRELCDGQNNNCKSGVDETFPGKGKECIEGLHPTCRQSGTQQCHPQGLTTKCSVTGISKGVSCNDGKDCTHTDQCTGGTLSDCLGTNYQCSGTCRVCDGKGTCGLSSATCYMTSCDKTQPGCSGTCFKAGDDPNGKQSSHKSGDTSCKYCEPTVADTKWTNRPPGSSWQCLDSSCSGLSFDPKHYCDSAGKCVDPKNITCDDGNVCTDNSCSDSNGCVYTNNTAVYDSNCYTGPSGTKDIGSCKGGTEYCKNGGPTTVCVGQVTPQKEICDGIDNDCDGEIDEGVKITYYRDADGDGYGDPNKTVKACKKPKGYVAGGDDCLDSGKVINPNGYTGVQVDAKDINPGQPELCNDVDDNCSGGTDGALNANGIDENFADKGKACSSADSASCLDSIKVCHPDGKQTMCIPKLTWGTYGFGGETTVIDISGFGNHGVDQVGHTTSDTPPIKVPTSAGLEGYPQSLKFDGSSHVVTVKHGNNKPYNITAPQLTMSAWVRWNGKGGSNIIVNKENSYEIAVNGGAFQCAIETQGSGGWFWTGNGSITSNKWHHVACTYARATCLIETWVDGEKKTSVKASGCTNVQSTTHDLRLGRRAGGSYFGGQIAAVGVYDIKLTDVELFTSSMKYTGPFPEVEANYEFCDGLNNNCKSGNDELYGDLGNSCSAGNGSCKNTGTRVCDYSKYSHDTNQTFGRSTICTVTGKGQGQGCNDGISCTHSDKCSGGANSSCAGTAYSCSGTCRTCDGKGTCSLTNDSCYITGGSCGHETPNCSGTCFKSGQDPSGKGNSVNSGNTSCKFCNPANSKNTWWNRPNDWVCRQSYCSGISAWNKTDICDGAGTCNDKGQVACNDKEVCTDDSCVDATGCKNTPNNYTESCYDGPPNTVDIGICHGGTRKCANGKFGDCIGDQLPLTEVCDDKDNDCDGSIDESGALPCITYYKDADGDGFGDGTDAKCYCEVTWPYVASKTGDCDDTNKNQNPAQKEKCNSFDDNCNGVNNEEGAIGCTKYYRDNDNDGYGQTGDWKCLCAPKDPYDTVLNNDCDDGNSAIHPNQTELCNSVDDDCEGGIDEDFDVGAACTKGIGTCKNTGTKVCNSAQTGTKCNVTGKPAGLKCADSNNCTHTDKCTGGDNSYCKGVAYSCDDGKSCTDNVCVSDYSKKCSYPIQSGKCLISGTCYNKNNKQSASGNGSCKYCNPGASTTQWTFAPGSWSCNPANCNGLTYYKTDYCGDKTGVCNDKGTENCNKGNVCKNYGCNTGGCTSSNKGNGTKCGGLFCAGETWHSKDFCQSGQCKDGGTQNCNSYTNSCRKGYCSGGCQIQNYKSGTKCGGQNCSGSTYNKKDKCDGSGNCKDGGTQNCSALSNQCRAGKCNNNGCYVSNYNTSTKCASGKSNSCSGNTWYYQDYCNGSGGCSDKGSTNCDSSDTSCRDYYCSGGCTYANKSTSTLCQGKYCSGSCNKINATYCNGSGSCSNGGANVSCGGNRCSGGNCTSSCSSNGQCCDTSGNNRTCIGGQCNNRQGCSGVCDGGDNADCKGMTCVNCNSNKCQHGGATYRCYKYYNSSSACGCGLYDSYNNCISWNTCWHC